MTRDHKRNSQTNWLFQTLCGLLLMNFPKWKPTVSLMVLHTESKPSSMGLATLHNTKINLLDQVYSFVFFRKMHTPVEFSSQINCDLRNFQLSSFGQELVLAQRKVKVSLSGLQEGCDWCPNIGDLLTLCPWDWMKTKHFRAYFWTMYEGNSVGESIW